MTHSPNPNPASPHRASFRDPAGFVFTHEGRIVRQVNTAGLEDYEAATRSGLYDALWSKGILLRHELVTDSTIPRTKGCHVLLEPEQLDYVSYPYEWSFSQLQDAARLTLQAQKESLSMGFCLKDASAYNVQFHRGKPILIDTLSFEQYRDDEPWVAYRQFCQHFLAPLALMTHTDIGLAKLLQVHIDGVPLELTSKLLPVRSWFKWGLLSHIHLHASMQSRYADSSIRTPQHATLSRAAQEALLDSLDRLVSGLSWQGARTEWGNYYDHTNYNKASALHKRELIGDFLTSLDKPLHLIQDLGANRGDFSRVAAQYCDLVISQDIDPVAVEMNYQSTKVDNTNILPLLQDLFAPSPAIGWANEERDSFLQRGSSDVVMALALIHHLAISNNVPLIKVASLLAGLAQWAIVEFVPKSDSQVKRLLQSREDVFPDYTEAGFELAFSSRFTIHKKAQVKESQRTLYLLKQIDQSV